MSRPFHLAAVLFVGVFGSAGAIGQAYPTKPLRFVSTGVGASTDLAARTVAQGLTDNLGWNIVVDNRGSTIMGSEMAARAAPDGYTILVMTDGLWRGGYFQKMPFDPDKSRLVELRYFAGLSIDETAAAMRISAATVDREWRAARAWLQTQLPHGS